MSAFMLEARASRAS